MDHTKFDFEEAFEEDEIENLETIEKETKPKNTDNEEFEEGGLQPEPANTENKTDINDASFIKRTSAKKPDNLAKTSKSASVKAKENLRSQSTQLSKQDHVMLVDLDLPEELHSGTKAFVSELINDSTRKNLLNAEDNTDIDNLINIDMLVKIQESKKNQEMDAKNIDFISQAQVEGYGKVFKPAGFCNTNGQMAKYKVDDPSEFGSNYRKSAQNAENILELNCPEINSEIDDTIINLYKEAVLKPKMEEVESRPDTDPNKKQLLGAINKLYNSENLNTYLQNTFKVEIINQTNTGVAYGDDLLKELHSRTDGEKPLVSDRIMKTHTNRLEQLGISREKIEESKVRAKKEEPLYHRRETIANYLAINTITAAKEIQLPELTSEEVALAYQNKVKEEGSNYTMEQFIKDGHAGENHDKRTGNSQLEASFKAIDKSITKETLEEHFRIQKNDSNELIATDELVDQLRDKAKDIMIDNRNGIIADLTKPEHLITKQDFRKQLGDTGDKENSFCVPKNAKEASVYMQKVNLIANKQDFAINRKQSNKNLIKRSKGTLIQQTKGHLERFGGHYLLGIRVIQATQQHMELIRTLTGTADAYNSANTAAKEIADLAKNVDM